MLGHDKKNWLKLLFVYMCLRSFKKFKFEISKVYDFRNSEYIEVRKLELEASTQFLWEERNNFWRVKVFSVIVSCINPNVFTSSWSNPSSHLLFGNLIHDIRLETWHLIVESGTNITFGNSHGNIKLFIKIKPFRSRRILHLNTFTEILSK